jgi:hypothetical protein
MKSAMTNQILKEPVSKIPLFSFWGICETVYACRSLTGSAFEHYNIWKQSKTTERTHYTWMMLPVKKSERDGTRPLIVTAT